MEGWQPIHKESEVSTMDDQSLAHSKYNCTYHIVFIPKYRRKIMYGEVRTEIGEIIKYICKLEGVELISGAGCVDHVHMYI